VGGEAGDLAGVAVRVEPEQRRHVLVVVSDRELGVEALAARRELAALRVEHAIAVGVSDAVDRHHLRLVEARGVVGAGGVAGVVVDEATLEIREDRSLAASRAPEGGVRELAEAFGVHVLELAAGGVVEREARLPGEALAEGQPAVGGACARGLVVRLHVLCGEHGPAALHLDAAEALFRAGEARASRVVEQGDARCVTAVKSYQHSRA
jgi:hypothetical protein